MYLSPVKTTTDILEVARLLAEQDVDAIPVEQDKQIIGVVRSFDVATALVEEIAGMKVKDVKYLKPPKVNNNDPVATAIEIMQTKKLDTLPIFTEGVLTGVVGLKDIIRKMINWSPKRDVSQRFNAELPSKAAQTDTNHFTSLPVDNFTEDPILSIQSTGTLSDAIILMQQNNQTSIVVMEGDQFQGMLSLRSVLSTIAKQQKVQNFSIQFVGLNDVTLTEHQNNVLHSITERYAEKLQRKIDHTFSVNLHLKETNKDGKQRLFEVKLKLEMPGKLLTSEKSDWDLETAIHKCFNIVEGQIYEK